MMPLRARCGKAACCRPRAPPRLPRMRIYTRTGDDGTTGLLGAGAGAQERAAGRGLRRRGRAERRARRVRALDPERWTEPTLGTVQAQLFQLGAELATTDPAALARFARARRPRGRRAGVRPSTGWSRTWRRWRTFILPGGSPLAAELHVARTVCRRAERRVVALAPAGGGRASPGALPEPSRRPAVRDGARMQSSRGRRGRRVARRRWDLAARDGRCSRLDKRRARGDNAPARHLEEGRCTGCPAASRPGPSSRGSLTALVLFLVLVAPARADVVVKEMTVSEGLSRSGDGTTLTALAVAGAEGRQTAEGGGVPVRIALAIGGAGGGGGPGSSGRAPARWPRRRWSTVQGRHRVTEHLRHRGRARRVRSTGRSREDGAQHEATLTRVRRQERRCAHVPTRPCPGHHRAVSARARVPSAAGPRTREECHFDETASPSPPWSPSRSGGRRDGSAGAARLAALPAGTGPGPLAPSPSPFARRGPPPQQRRAAALRRAGPRAR